MTHHTRHTTVDRTLPLLREGYRFLPRRRHRYRSDVFELRVLGERVNCVSGPDAARLFYDEGRFTRAGALPEPVRGTLMGEGGVQTLDGPDHRHRKSMFMSLLNPDRVDGLAGRAFAQWRRVSTGWPGREVVLFDEAAQVFTAAACEWVGVPVAADEVPAVARDMVAMVDGFASVGPRHWRARLARRRRESWAARRVRQVRHGDVDLPADAPVRVVAGHRDLTGWLLPEHTAAVEVLNLIRPAVAVAWYVPPAMAVLANRPQWLQRLREGDEQGLDLFVRELRRWHPFTPLLGARARHSFEWRGQRFPRGRMVLLDVYGILHDPRWWPGPGRFEPTRFAGRRVDPFAFIPQGGGDPHVTHRCPGEPATVELIKSSLRWLVQWDWQLPVQELRTPLNRVPTGPPDGFVMVDLRPRQEGPASGDRAGAASAGQRSGARPTAGDVS